MPLVGGGTGRQFVVTGWCDTIARVFNTGRGKLKKGARLTAVDSVPPGGDDLAELRRQLAAAGAPDEVLRALEVSGDVDEALDRLIESGLLPPPESLTAMLEGWKPLLTPSCDAFSAELSGAEFLSMTRFAQPDEDELLEMLAALIQQAEAGGTREALAMLRVLAVVAQPRIRDAAAEAAGRMVAAGLADPAWVSGLGAPQVGPCFGYADELAAQEAITVSFTYGGKAHAFAVLIDHDLGGGVKDCFPTEQPDQVRADYQQAARQTDLEFHDYDPAEARAILDRALAKPPCPVEPDQIEDVSDYLDLLRQRVALLPDGGTAPPAPRGPARERSARGIHKVKITLRGSKPPIWRRLEVPSGITLHQLHECIQQTFGWEDYHMWVFSTLAGDYGIADRELGHRSAAAKKLSDAAPRVGDRIRYTYDFGDGWEHDLLVEDVFTAEPGLAYPRCTAGRRAGPPEDCGGIWGYQELQDVLANPDHPEHDERLEWLGLKSVEEFDPARFDVDEANEVLSELAQVLVQG